MGLRCHMCSSIFANLSLQLNHWMRVHGQDANLNILCGVGGCGHTENFLDTEATCRETTIPCGKTRRRSWNYETW